jgi:hypothetical protein
MGKMEGYCSTGQSRQRAVVPMEEEEELKMDRTGNMIQLWRHCRI